MPVTITRTAWIDDDGSGTTGTVINNAVKTELYNQIDEGFALLDVEAAGDLTVTGNLHVTGQIYELGRATPIGYPIGVPFNAADYFAGSPLVWTVTAGNVECNVYSLVGKQMTWNISITGGSLTGSAGPYLKVRMPSGITPHPTISLRGSVICKVAGTEIPAHSYAVAGVPEITIYPLTGNMPTGTTELYMNLAFWIG